MAVINYYSHIPMIRSAEESRPLGPGLLWRFPFEAWNAQTAGAFEDHKEAYDQTAPMFFFIEIEVDWPILAPGQQERPNNIELKKPTYGSDKEFEEMGFGFLTQFLKTFGWTAQAALTLAAPAAAPGSPRSSMTICVPDDHYFQIGKTSGILARIQGDADHEWLLLPGASGPPLPASSVDLASSIWRFAEAAGRNETLSSAINALLMCAEPSLLPRDQMVLATIALEALLLPEVRSQLKKTFADRLATLLSTKHDASTIARIARLLYDARSAALHGSQPKDLASAEAITRCCGAQQLLAASILALGPSVLAGVPLPDLREKLDAGNALKHSIPASPLDLDSPPGLRTSNRLSHATYTSMPYSYVSGGVMYAEEGAVASWSPLLGLACDETLGVREGGFAIVPLNAVELVELEERDIRRDFISQLRSNDALGVLPVEQIGCIGLFDKGRHDLADLRRRRSQAVAVLRLAGFSKFIDPELLGWYVYEGMVRYRIPTVFRQSILKTIVHEPDERISESDLERVGALAALLAQYATDHSDGQMDELVGEFLRAHPSRFFPSEASAGLLFAILEEVLGRFRPRRAAVQLEDLVARVTGASESEWFRERGRAFRNAVAHGRWNGEENKPDLAFLLAMIRQIMEALIRYRVQHDQSASPVKSFLTHLEKEVKP
jgi:hypothetical protein